MGANLGCAIVTNGDFTAYVCDSAATRPSYQITLGRLVILIIIIIIIVVVVVVVVVVSTKMQPKSEHIEFG